MGLAYSEVSLNGFDIYQHVKGWSFTWVQDESHVHEKQKNTSPTYTHANNSSGRGLCMHVSLSSYWLLLYLYRTSKWAIAHNTRVGAVYPTHHVLCMRKICTA